MLPLLQVHNSTSVPLPVFPPVTSRHRPEDPYTTDGPTTLHVCTWIDATEHGLAVFPKSVSYAQADRYSLTLWKASEHS